MPAEGFTVLADGSTFCAKDTGTRRSVTTTIVAVMSVNGLRIRILLTTPMAVHVVPRARWYTSFVLFIGIIFLTYDERFELVVRP
jgi:hypothetical protein